MKHYETPEVTVTTFTVEDVVTTSGGASSCPTDAFDGIWVTP